MIARVLPFAAFIAALALQPLLADQLDGRWLTVARGLMAGTLLLAFHRSYVELRDAPPLSAAAWSASIALGAAVAVLWVCLDAPWMYFGAGTGGFAPVREDGTLDLAMVALRLAGFVVVVPVMEELFWRSFLMRWIDRRDFLTLDPRLVTPLALAATSALFALEHSAWLAGLAAGLAYGAIYRRTGNLWAAVLSHGVSNLLLGAWILARQDWSLW